ncbi:MAG TPA: methyltransferase domain-containing protein, partial [Ornithinibacter sp.]|nr:methyltransferase domain-containing protein [Ornithinibacter sp.]
MADERARSRRAGGPPGLRTAAVHGALDAFAARRSAELGRPLRVLDLGGGTGGTAVPLAVAGHDVTVVDPSPDALASLRRRAAETDTSRRIHPVQGDTDTLRDLGVGGELAADGEPAAYDLVCLHGTLEVVDDPDAA